MKPAPKKIPAKWAWHRETLLRLRAKLREARDEHDHAVRVPHERGGADALDFAEDEVELRTLRTELAQEDFELSEIEAALARLKTGPSRPRVCVRSLGRGFRRRRPNSGKWRNAARQESRVGSFEPPRTRGALRLLLLYRGRKEAGGGLLVTPPPLLHRAPRRRMGVVVGWCVRPSWIGTKLLPNCP
jgi:hypothetical protein